MPTLIIPKTITQGDTLVVVPRRDWEKLKRIAQAKISQLELKAGLKQAVQEFRTGKIMGPFDNSDDLIKSLESK